MSTSSQLTHYLRNNKRFGGVYSSDLLPDPQTLPHDGCIIVNYSASDEGPGSHWAAVIHINNPQEVPAWFDSFGLDIDSTAEILHLQHKPDFRGWIENASRLAGHDGKFDQNKLELQCVESTVCGQWCILCIRLNTLPMNEQGKIRAQWKPFVHWKNGACHMNEKALRKIIKLI